MPTVRTKVTTKGQVTIPVEVRRRLGVTPRQSVAFVVDGNIRLEWSRSYSQRSAGIFRGRGPASPPTERDLKEAAASGWVERQSRDAS